MRLENKEHLKKFLFLSLVPIIFFLIIGNTFFYYQYHTYTKNYNNKINSIVTLIQEKYPNIDQNELIEILNNQKSFNNDNFLKHGIDIKKESLILENNRDFKFFLIFYNILIIFSFLSIIFLYLRHEKKLDREIKKIVRSIEQINKKNYSIDISDNGEDILSILKNEIYKTTIMLKEAAENSKADKLKLKKSLSDISHQLKTPLTSINIMLDNILDNPNMDNKTKEKFVQNIKREIINMNFLIQEILKLSKFDANVIKFNNKQVYVSDIINMAISNVEMLAEIKNIKIKLEIISDSKIICDLKWQAEAIANILKNCLEHSLNNSTIIINIGYNKVYNKITIIDYGEGIDKKDLPHIFKRYYKAKNSSKDSVGIGLSLAKSIINKNNGTITVDSIKNKYTKFVIKYYQ